MVRLIITCAISLLFAFMAASNTPYEHMHVQKNIFYYLSQLFLVLFAGLRVSYNDTYTYIANFNSCGTIQQFLQDSRNLSFYNNPLFGFLMTSCHSISKSVNVFFLIVSMITIAYGFKLIRETVNRCDFAFAVFLYIAFGNYVFSMGAMKQALAMAIVFNALLQLINEKKASFIVWVLVASLIHSYAIFLLVMLLFDSEPWNFKTYCLLIMTIAVCMAFNSVFGGLMDYVNSSGGSLSESELFDNNKISLFRMAVFSVTPLLLFRYRFVLNLEMDREQRILSNMSILGLMFMLLGSVNAANLFGRMARYFSVGTVCMIPWILENAPVDRRMIKIVCIISFCAFFLYDIKNFDKSYWGVSLSYFLKSL